LRPRGRGRKKAVDSDSPDPGSMRGGAPDESELEVVTTHFLQVEIARKSAGSVGSASSSQSQDCLLGHLKAMEGHLTANMLRAADSVVCSMQRQIPAVCVIIPEVLHPPTSRVSSGAVTVQAPHRFVRVSSQPVGVCGQGGSG